MNNSDNYDDFNEYMKYYKSLPLSDKKEIIINELKTLSAVTNEACVSLGVKNEVLIDRELLDINGKEYNDDDYVEGLMVYICSIKNSLCDLIEGLNEITNK